MACPILICYDGSTAVHIRISDHTPLALVSSSVWFDPRGGGGAYWCLGIVILLKFYIVAAFEGKVLFDRSID